MISRTARKTITKHRANRSLEMQAESGSADAANALAARERTKTRRQLTLASLAILAIGGAGIFGAKSLDKFGGMFKGAVPHQDAAIDVHNSLKKVTLPNKTVLVEGTGTGSASVNIRYESKAPIIGSLFNHTFAKLTDMNSAATRSGKVQIGSDRNAIELTAKNKPAYASGKSQWVVAASVDVDKLYSQSAQMTTDKLSSNSDVLSFATEKGVVKRIGQITQLADTSFGNACSDALVADIPSGVRLFVRDQLQSVASFERSQGHKKEASRLSSLASRPIDVTFYRTDRTGVGVATKSAVPVQSLTLPHHFVPTESYIANQLGKPVDDVHVNTEVGSCSFEPLAMSQQMQILGNTATPDL